MGTDFGSLIGQLGEASLQAKGLVRELHAAVKDARSVLRDVAAERAAVEAMVKRSVEDEIRDTVKAEMAQVAEECQKLLLAASDRVIGEFGKLEKAIFTGSVGNRARGIDLREVARQVG